MNEFDENEKRSEDLPEAPQDEALQNEAPEENAPQNEAPEENTPQDEAPEYEPPKPVSEPDPAPQPQKLPEQPDFSGHEWAYSWDGQTYKKRSSGKGARRFFLIAAACLLVSIAICLPTILYAVNSDRKNTPSGTSSVTGESTAEQSIGGDTSYEVSQIVTPTTDPYEEESTLISVYANCSPSCCTIYVTSKAGYSLGSGFVLTADGYIATNQHVVDGGTKFKAIFYDGTEYNAKVVGEDAVRDLAVLKIEAKNLKPLAIGNSDKLVPGQTVIAIGTPYDLSLAGTMTMGVISGTKRSIDITDSNGRVTKTMTLIQTDTSINPGNSGGPLINLKGQVVGINSLKIVEDYFEGIGFAIPINYASEIFNQLIQYGKVVNEPKDDFVHAAAYLGIQVYNLEKGLEQFRIHPQCEYPEGVLVASTTPGTSVYAAGLQLCDIITEFCGVKITNVNDLTGELAKHKAGETVTMKLFRFDRRFTSGEELTISFVLDSAS